jgi:hypothetical protein
MSGLKKYINDIRMSADEGSAAFQGVTSTLYLFFF